jgi:outer membrane autotransporter protein
LVDLNVRGQSYDLVQSGLGAKIAHDFTLYDMQVLSPEVHVNWLHSFGNDTMSNTAAFAAGGPNFTVLGVKPAREIYDVGAGLVLASNKTWSVNGDYDYQWGNGYRAGQAMIKFTLSL